MPNELDGEIEDIERHLDDAEWASRADALTRAGTLLAQCLDEAAFRRVLGLLEQGAKDPKWEVRRAAALALGQTGDERAAAVLERMEGDDNRYVRETASRARRMSEVTGASPSDPALDQILAEIGRARRRKLSADDLLTLARRFGDIHYGDLASETAHELRTVVTAVEGCMTALEHRLHEIGREDGTVAELGGRLRERTRFLTRLVDDLCTYTQTPGEFAAVRLREVVDLAIEFARGRASAAQAPTGVGLRVEVPEDLIVDAARERMVHALANLITNALEAMSTVGEVRVTAAAVEPDLVVVRVIDNGCGMEPQQVKDAQRRYSSSKRKRGDEVVAQGEAPHAGLGLPIAIRIIEREHNGRVQIESQPGRGTTVTAEIPRTQRRGGGG